MMISGSISRSFLIYLKFCLLTFVCMSIVGCGSGGAENEVAKAVVSVSISKQNVELFDEQQFQFSASVSGTDIKDVLWSADYGVITDSGIYTAPVEAGTYTVKATSKADPSKSATSVVKVKKIYLQADESHLEFLPLQSKRLKVKVSGDTNTEVGWSLPENNSGVIADTGIYRAPKKPGNYHVKVTSKVDPRKTILLPVVVIPARDNSYENYKSIGLQPAELPTLADARGFADVNDDGFFDLIAAEPTYWGKPFSESGPANLKVWLGDADGNLRLNTTILPKRVNCIHTRKLLITDFNQDEIKDFLFICHGYDAAPHPGEKNQLLLSSINGYIEKPLSDDIGFFHSGSTADINFDGYPDVVLVNNANVISPVYFMINNKDGTFSSNYSYLPDGLARKNYYTSEFVDVNQDNIVDLIIGGHEWENASTLVLINPGDFNFKNVVPAVIPAVPNEGVVLDFTVTVDEGQVNVWVNRTSGGDGTFYQSLTVQKYKWPAGVSEIAFSERPKTWTPWLIPAIVDGKPVLTSDRKSDKILINRRLPSQ